MIRLPRLLTIPAALAAAMAIAACHPPHGGAPEPVPHTLRILRGAPAGILSSNDESLSRWASVRAREYIGSDHRDLYPAPGEDHCGETVVRAVADGDLGTEPVADLVRWLNGKDAPIAVSLLISEHSEGSTGRQRTVLEDLRVVCRPQEPGPEVSEDWTEGEDLADHQRDDEEAAGRDGGAGKTDRPDPESEGSEGRPEPGGPGRAPGKPEDPGGGDRPGQDGAGQDRPGRGDPGRDEPGHGSPERPGEDGPGAKDRPDDPPGAGRPDPGEHGDDGSEGREPSKPGKGKR
ncbi:hypothetical protein [Salininema proteolyticum]|uniref:Uncharacterized protein n=1 Tax=Salininema proteolyticum TaxID=1607685 RepID=A0ABV8U0J6_9ACTN